MSDNLPNNEWSEFNKSKTGCSSYISATGFEYIDDGNTARCKQCGFKVFNCTSNMDLFDKHFKQKPDCPFVHCNTTSAVSHPLCPSSQLTNDQENPSKRQKTQNLYEGDEALQQVRINTFSHWKKYDIPLSEQMIKAGFFSCNVDDRVICISCNLICQQWIPHIDDPSEVHKTLSPDCMYVKLKLMRPEPPPPPPITNTTERLAKAISNNYSSTSTNFVLIAPRHPGYSEISKRLASFGTWPNDNSPSVDELVQAGFFYTLMNTRVTCFYCNGSLHGWNSSHNPMIEHARYFPQCAYARQLCGDELYRKIQESNRAQQERARTNKMKDKAEQLLMQDDDTLSKKVEAGLKSVISENFVNQKFELSIVKQCWEDQLRLKQKDFISENDLDMACLIFQKQREYINGKKRDVIIPSESMKQHREQAKNKQAEILSRRQAGVLEKPEIPNPCVQCWKKEKQLACIPCGHPATCIPCGQELQQCPICRREIDAFVQVYL